MAKQTSYIGRLSRLTISAKMELLQPFYNTNGEVRTPIFAEEKVVFWLQLIIEYCEAKKIAVFDVDSLTTYVGEMAGAPPRCLGGVIAACVRAKKLQNLPTMMALLKPKEPNEETGWIIGRAVFNAWRCLYQSITGRESMRSEEDMLVTSKFVVPHLVEVYADQLIKKLISKAAGSEMCYVTNLRKEVNGAIDDDATFDLVLLTLQEQIKCLLVKVESGRQIFVLIRDKDSFVLPSEDDLAIFELESKAKDLNDQVEALRKTIKGLEKQALKLREKFDSEKYESCRRSIRLAEEDLETKKLEIRSCISHAKFLKDKKVEEKNAKRRTEDPDCTSGAKRMK